MTYIRRNLALTNIFALPGEDLMRTTAALIMIFLPVIAWAEALDETRHLELSAANIQTLKIECGSGFLTTIGVKGSDRIRATGQIEVKGIQENEFQKYLENQLRFTLEKQGKDAVLQADISKSFLRKIEAKINLTVRVPRMLAVTIDDGSGAIMITGLAGGLKLVDGSGSIDIINMAGRIKIADGSGRIDIEDVRGDVEVQDGSGRIRINLVKGNVSITDGSGSITVQDINGNVTLTDGSGSIEIQDVTQNVYLNAAGSGTVDIEGVKGRVTRRE
jgi:DUF4097 and DUF4098 domain-containing protein YvlB